MYSLVRRISEQCNAVYNFAHNLVYKRMLKYRLSVISNAWASSRSLQFYRWRNSRNPICKACQLLNELRFGCNAKSWRWCCFNKLWRIQWQKQQHRRRFWCQRTEWHMPSCSTTKWKYWRNNLNCLSLKCYVSFVLWMESTNTTLWT